MFGGFYDPPPTAASTPAAAQETQVTPPAARTPATQAPPATHAPPPTEYVQRQDVGARNDGKKMRSVLTIICSFVVIKFKALLNS